METGKIIIKTPAKITKEPFVVKFVIIHPMEPGTRKDPKTGAVIPAHHLTSIKLMFDGTPVSEFTTGPGVSQNPRFGAMLKAEKSGELKIVCQDNKGGNWEKTHKITL